jgi:hypothetical protein
VLAQEVIQLQSSSAEAIGVSAGQLQDYFPVQPTNKPNV